MTDRLMMKLLPCPRCGKPPTEYETEPFVFGFRGFYCQDSSHGWEPTSSEPQSTRRAAIEAWNDMAKAYPGNADER
jgi:Restriction alleviation protein Lar